MYQFYVSYTTSLDVDGNQSFTQKSLSNGSVLPLKAKFNKVIWIFRSCFITFSIELSVVIQQKERQEMK